MKALFYTSIRWSTLFMGLSILGRSFRKRYKKKSSLNCDDEVATPLWRNRDAGSSSKAAVVEPALRDCVCYLYACMRGHVPKEPQCIGSWFHLLTPTKSRARVQPTVCVSSRCIYIRAYQTAVHSETQRAPSKRANERLPALGGAVDHSRRSTAAIQNDS